MVIILLWYLLFWGQSWEARLGQDAMTYGALAKHILETGDWKILHYCSQAYENFYQHPPFIIWITALIFKVFGSSDITARILPSFFSLGTVLLVFYWGKRIRSQEFGFLASLVLLTSTRFVKYGATLMLDGPMAFWMTLFGFILHTSVKTLHHPKSAHFELHSSSHFNDVLFLGMGLGMTMAAALFTKGIPALSLPFLLFLNCMFTTLTFGKRSKPILLATFIGIIFSLFLLGLWFYLGEGLTYLNHYWNISVKSRIFVASFSEHYEFAKNLIQVYWPWIPFYLFGLVVFLKSFFFSNEPNQRILKLISPLGIAVNLSLIILLGYSYVGHFLEHYTLPFYPFSALVVTSVIEEPLRRFNSNIQKGLLYFSLFWAFLLATIPLHIHGEEYKNPERNLLRKAASQCQHSKIKKLYISNLKTELWLGLALGLWNTPWDTAVVDPLSSNLVMENTLFLIEREFYLEHKTFFLSHGWTTTDLSEKDFVLLKRRDENPCFP